LHWFSLENIETGLAAGALVELVQPELCSRCREDFMEQRIKLDDGRELIACRHCGWSREVDG
jgi:formylmethanofuran dehydrogenase subunit E